MPNTFNIDKTIADFQQQVWRYFDQNGRHDLPWRRPEVMAVAAGNGGSGSGDNSDSGDDGRTGEFDPYKITVSELMLQQTQVARVVSKFESFIARWPRAEDLAKASLGEVLTEWQGLGYNRRAKFLWQAAHMVTSDFGGTFPRSRDELVRLPGVGANTAGAIMAYAYDQPVDFIETNIRTVYIHHFFDDQTGVADKAISDLVRQTLPAQDARLWYWALMDYGTRIKQQHGNKSRASKSYAKQSPFHGSRRQVRGAVIRYLSRRGTGGSLQDLAQAEPDPRLADVLRDLVAEGLVREEAGNYRLA